VMKNATNLVAAIPRLAASAATTAVTPAECAGFAPGEGSGVACPGAGRSGAAPSRAACSGVAGRGGPA
jgi:hypothetical protein